jgi:hypothetical protein
MKTGAEIGVWEMEIWPRQLVQTLRKKNRTIIYGPDTPPLKCLASADVEVTTV